MEKSKKHYKLYKSGKLWITAAIAVGMFSVTSVTAQASSSANAMTAGQPTQRVVPTQQVDTKSQLIDNKPAENVNTSDQSVDDTKLNQSVDEAKKANVAVTEDNKAAKTTEIQGTESADASAQVTAAQASDKADYAQQITDLNVAKEKEVAYEKAVNTGKKDNIDGKTQIATSSNTQALKLDKSKPVDESTPTGNIQPTNVYSGSDEKASPNMASSTKVWEYSGNQVIGATITKNWAKAGTIAIRDSSGQIVEKSVDLNETFHDFQVQNGNWSDTSDYHDQGIPKVTISSNAVDNVEMWNVNWQTTFWFTYSGTKQIVPISKLTGSNDDPKFYFLSASISGSLYTGAKNPTQWEDGNWQPNEREYVQTNDASTVVIQPNSTVGLETLAQNGVVTNLPHGMGYTQTGAVYPKTDDDDPDVYALQEGVSFADFNTDKPTLYLGAVPIEKSARWWHSNHNMNSDELAFVQKPKATYHKAKISHTQVPIVTINEKINYVDEFENPIHTVYDTNNATNKKFVTITRTTADGNQYQEMWVATGEVANPNIVRTTTKDVNTGKDVIDEVITNTGWTIADAGVFPAVRNPIITGYHVIKTTDAAQDLNETTNQTVTNTEPNQLREITVIYVHNNEKAIVSYIDDNTGKTLETKELIGKYGTTDQYRTAGTIKNYEDKGYVLNTDNPTAADNYPRDGITYDQDGVIQSFEVHLKHTSETISPSHPKTPGDAINPNDPASPSWPKETGDVERAGSQTVSYSGAGDKTPGAVVTTDAHAFQREVTVDKVTGAVTQTSDWTTQTFKSVLTPTVEGYHADKGVAGGLTATVDQPDVKEAVVYTANGKLVPVDQDGQEIPGADQPIYPTDPTDPTKVVPNEAVPGVENYTPDATTPVTPSDPSADTTVPYHKNGQITVTDNTKNNNDVKPNNKHTINKSSTVNQQTKTSNKARNDEHTGNVSLPKTAVAEHSNNGVLGMMSLGLIGMMSVIVKKRRK
ncbi:hypothetical protein GCM10025878_05680 [Leuconostoc gasicomitatum]|uniref:Contains gram positive anchor domain n=3 Tax=Leuconostoc TaxID=1243 RepID=A0AAN2QW64_9LACO|nr:MULTISPECIES: KxYKxGKxW signal peptide domain-containing protein [Leuconostoc]MBZ5947538.1 KxYKxGKxW signal peptide domain-containing protein [Leuconostoc gasicomitatum]MBZ5957068.1 KxYKxGKxW signal peptide domain-containing protein [Leuconostoc gasicomitatum]MBZ5958454.1 KxYKxGKxW signal peptide domain-containing protein [Leuconostoc gasicomitatum]MBZ5960436.1 KxYKxGKxW signal peptide domain-containing protein [Leuconostoc gasicomitatum]MBZ5965418.1 KxYKxGKxW signal peptide domain-containi